MAYDELLSNGVTKETPDNILLGAGTIHKGLKFDATKKAWNFQDSLVGATSGGNKLAIKPDILSVDVDGVLVRMKGLDVKQGEAATLEINFVETTPDIIKVAIIGKDGTTTSTGYQVIESKADIEDGDYWENVAFVGKTITGKPIIVILDNALCTSGLDLDNKSKKGTAGKYTFACSQVLAGDGGKLPYHIYYPTTTTVGTGS